MTPQLPDALTNLAAQGALHTQLDPTDPHVAVLVLSPDRQTILDADLRPLSEITALLAAQHMTNPQTT